MFGVPIGNGFRISRFTLALDLREPEGRVRHANGIARRNTKSVPE